MSYCVCQSPVTHNLNRSRRPQRRSDAHRKMEQSHFLNQSISITLSGPHSALTTTAESDNICLLRPSVDGRLLLATLSHVVSASARKYPFSLWLSPRRVRRVGVRRSVDLRYTKLMFAYTSVVLRLFVSVSPIDAMQ